MEIQLFSPNLQGNWSIGYDNKKLGLNMDWTGRLLSPMHLPQYPAPHDRPATSPWFTEQNLQLGKTIKQQWNVSLGIRNMWNYRQQSPLIAPDDPFGEAFDTNYIYGPLQGRRWVIGLGYRIAAKQG